MLSGPADDHRQYSVVIKEMHVFDVIKEVIIAMNQ